MNQGISKNWSHRKLHLFIQLILLLLAGGVVIWWLSYGNICQLPIKYRLGSIDARFNVPEEKVKESINLAEQWWESSLGIELFEYDPTAEHPLIINFVFDDRQRITKELQHIQAKKLATKDKLDDLTNSYQDLRSLYEQRGIIIDDLQQTYDDQLKQFERTVNIWNERGGVSPEIYAELQQEQAKLEGFVSQINDLIVEQNDLAKQINSLAEGEAQTVQLYNESVRKFNDTFPNLSESFEEEQGIYSLDKINVYQFDNQDDLVLLLTHEMGHALGLDHSDQPQSIMFPKKNDRQAVGEAMISEQSRLDLQKRCNLR
jgi:hypothetical protein